jgi:hypothetical protein
MTTIGQFSLKEVIHGYDKRFSELKNFMNSEDQIHLIPDFVAYHNKKDMHRNQSTVSVFPELASIFS